MRCALLLAAAHAAPKTIVLNNGVEMPLLSLGTAGFDDAESEEAVKLAYKAGIRAIDTAFNYYNQKGVGRGLKAVNRSEVFLVTKTTPCYHPQAPPRYNISNPIECAMQTEKDILSNLEQLQEEYIDLLLLHGPNQFGAASCTKETCALDAVQWGVYETMLKKGKVRAIGVSNYCSSCLSCLLGGGRVTPAVNQVECHPYLQQEELLQHCRKHNIVLTAYSPLGGPERPWAKEGEPTLLDDPKIKAVADKFGKSNAHVCIRFQIQRGIVVIPKSVTPSRIEDNMKVFDFEMTEEDLNVVRGFHNGWRACVPAIPGPDGKDVPRDASHPFYPFNIPY
mmetsp:Transcript_31891/g.77756  ORF Transcript_31891/g.77756 Transcript_31891/m.77756 type:complete len:336 (+) Transcript_31891:42-1049(+)